MSSRKYTADPDRGSLGLAPAKRTLMVDTEEWVQRREVREGARELDEMVESMPGLARSQRDRARSMPRATVAELGHARMRRGLPAADTVRAPLSSRQRKARSKTKRLTQGQLSRTELTTLTDMVTDERTWRSVNDRLSDVASDTGEFTEQQRLQTQRMDRVIQRYEKHNDRGHLVYSRAALPAAVNKGNLTGFIGNHLAPGTEVAFDRYTAAAHTLHEVEPGGRPDHPVFEIRTRRGAYLGRSDSVDDTAHVLPRGMRLWVAGSHEATYQRPDGTTRTRTVVQLSDEAPHPQEGQS